MRFRPSFPLLVCLLTLFALALSLPFAPWYRVWPFELVGACYFWLAAATLILLGGLLSGHFLKLPVVLPSRRRWVCVAALAMALSFYVNTTLGWSLMRPAQAAPASMDAGLSDTTLNVMTYNVNVKAWDKDAVATVVREHPVDVLGLVEPRRSQVLPLSQDLADLYPYYYQSTQAGPWEDLSLLSRYPIVEAKVDDLGTSTPSLFAILEVDGTAVQVALVHPKIPVRRSTFNQRNDTILALADYARTSQQASTAASPRLPLIMMGDFNAVPWSAYMQDFTERSQLRSAFLGHGLRLTWYYANTAPQAWVKDRLFRLLKIPIDHIFVSADFTVENLATAPSGISDHCALLAELRLRSQL